MLNTDTHRQEIENQLFLNANLILWLQKFRTTRLLPSLHGFFFFIIHQSQRRGEEGWLIQCCLPALLQEKVAPSSFDSQTAGQRGGASRPR